MTPKGQKRIEVKLRLDPEDYNIVLQHMTDTLTNEKRAENVTDAIRAILRHYAVCGCRNVSVRDDEG